MSSNYPTPYVYNQTVVLRRGPFAPTGIRLWAMQRATPQDSVDPFLVLELGMATASLAIDAESLRDLAHHLTEMAEAVEAQGLDVRAVEERVRAAGLSVEAFWHEANEGRPVGGMPLAAVDATIEFLLERARAKAAQ